MWRHRLTPSPRLAPALVAIWLGWSTVAWSAPSPPLPEEEAFDDVEALLSDIGRRRGATQAMAWSPAGRTIATGSEDSVLRLWEVESGREDRRWKSRYSKVRAVAWSPDGKTLASASGPEDHQVCLWAVETGTERCLGSHAGEIHALAWSPDGRRLASGSDDRTVRVWEIGSGDALPLEDHPSGVRALAWNPGGTLLASGSAEGEVRLWDVGTARRLKTLPGSDGDILAVAWSADGATVAVGTSVFRPTVSVPGSPARPEAEVRFWSSQTGAEIRRLRVPAESAAYQAMDFHLDHGILALGTGDGTILLWDAENDLEVGRLTGPTEPLRSLAFRPDGKVLASSSLGDAPRLWDLAAAQQILRLEGHREPVLSVTWSPGGETLALGSADSTVRLWESLTGQELRSFSGAGGGVEALAFHPGGETLAAGTAWGGRAWDLLGEEVDLGLRELSGITGMAWSPDGQTVAVGLGADDPRVLLSGSGDGSGKRALEAFNPIRAVAWNPLGGQLAAATDGYDVLLWSSAGQLLRTFKGHDQKVRTVAWSPDGTLLASGSDDATVRAWDSITGREVRRLAGHDQGVGAVAWSPDGTLLASGSDDATVRVWETETGRELQRLDHPLEVNSVAWYPDGSRLASASSDGMVRLWSKEGGGLRLSQLLVSGQRGTWISCRLDGRCRRRDDGTLLVQVADDGRLEPVRPQEEVGTHLELVHAPAELVTEDGEVADLRLVLRNPGPGRAFAIRVRSSGLPGADPVVLHPPPALPSLEPGEEAEILGGVSVHSSHRDPAEQSVELDLEVVHAGGEPVAVPPIVVRAMAPKLRWDSARRSGDTVWVSLTNVGRQDLGAILFTLDIPDGQRVRSGVSAIAAAESVSLPFSFPEDFSSVGELRVTVVAHQKAFPRHVWTFADQPVGRVGTSWPLVVVGSLLLASLGAVGLRLHPIVLRLSADPEALLSRPPAELSRTRSLLALTRRLTSVLDETKVDRAWLDGAVTFVTEADPGERCRYLTSRLGAEPRPVEPARPDLPAWTVPLDPDFPLELDAFVLVLPPAELPAADVLAALGHQPEIRDRVTLIVGATREQRGDLHRLAADPGTLWVAPSEPELTRLLLSPDASRALAQLTAGQVRLRRLSPYQSGGAVRKEAMFFGRERILAQVLHGKAGNHLVVGARQIGKSSLLRAVERRGRASPGLSCHYLALTGPELLGRLAEALGLDPASRAEAVFAHLRARGRESPVLFLVDEVDSFVRSERDAGYPLLPGLRGLSEEGCCRFLFAGYRHLYEAAVRDYHSPLGNFGELVEVGALEAEACAALARRPMESMNLSWASESLIERLVAATGRRANLVSIACHEILEALPAGRRTIEPEDLERALAGRRIGDALGMWRQLSRDSEESCLDRVLVYATVRDGSFTLSEALARLEDLGRPVSTEKVRASLDRLRLAFVVGEEKGRYGYRVPLLRERILERDPEALLGRELRTG